MNDKGFRMNALCAFKGAGVVSRLARYNPSKWHSFSALGTRWTLDFGYCRQLHDALPVLQAGAQFSLSRRPPVVPLFASDMLMLRPATSRSLFYLAHFRRQ